MHDGRFPDLKSTLDFMSSGMKMAPFLDPSLLHNGKAGIPLTEAEKQNLIAFLKTLSDPSYLKNSRFSNPF